jgi:hypothetical protein
MKATASRNSRWNLALCRTVDGRALLRVGRGHPLADSRGYARVSRVVLASAGIHVGAGDVVHHANEDVTDDRLSNLVVTVQKAHAAQHAATQGRDRHGHFASKEATP